MIGMNEETFGDQMLRMQREADAVTPRERMWARFAEYSSGMAAKARSARLHATTNWRRTLDIEIIDDSGIVSHYPVEWDILQGELKAVYPRCPQCGARERRDTLKIKLPRGMPRDHSFDVPEQVVRCESCKSEFRVTIAVKMDA